MISQAGALWCRAEKDDKPRRHTSTAGDSRYNSVIKANCFDGAVSVDNESGWIVFDGMIYNARDLGHSGTDGAADQTAMAALILSLVLTHGIDALQRVNGIFAFVIWDARRCRLVAARDRFGLRTLYWHKTGNGLAIGPRMFPLLDAVGSERRINHESAVEFLLNSFTDQDEKTLLHSVSQLPAGAALEFVPSTGCAKIHNWYELPTPYSKLNSKEDAVAGFRSLLADAVRMRSQTTKPGGLMLSAGIDSSAIAGLLEEQGTWRPLRTYKTYFNSPSHDVQEHVSAVVERTGAKHRRTSIVPMDLFRFRDDILRALEVPYERSIVSAHWALCELMAEDGIHLTLDGVGADEQLGGYRIFQSSFAAFQRGEKPRGLAFVGTSRPPESFLPAADLDRLFKWLAPGARATALDSIRGEHVHSIDSFTDMCSHHMHRGALPMLLRFNRDIGRAFGQESTSPFMDHNLVEFSLGLDDNLKISNGCSKYVLRRAMAGLVPNRIARYDNKTSYLDIEVNWLAGAGFALLSSGVKRAESELPSLLMPSELATTKGVTDKLNILRMWRIDCLGAWVRLFGVAV